MGDISDLKKRADVKTVSKCNKKILIHLNALKRKKSSNEFGNIYLKEQTECIQNQINKIRDSVDDRQSRIACQTVNEVSRTKSTAKAKLKANSQKEQIQLWKQYFENLYGKPLKVAHEPIVVYWPSTRPNMPFQRRGSCILWDKVTSHGTVRLMHRKRVTCELHDSYFRSMTIKHTIPRTAEVTHPDGQLWGDIEWAIELL